MLENDKDIELRSEKVRNIVGKVPSALLRKGITIISIVIIGVLTGTYFMPYPEYIPLKLRLYTNTTITSEDEAIVNSNCVNNVYGIGYVSNRVRSKIKIGQKVEVKISETKESITGYVSTIYSEPIYIDNYSISKIEILIPNSLILFKNTGSSHQEAEGIVLASKMSVLEHFINQ